MHVFQIVWMILSIAFFFPFFFWCSFFPLYFWVVVCRGCLSLYMQQQTVHCSGQWFLFLEYDCSCLYSIINDLWPWNVSIQSLMLVILCTSLENWLVYRLFMWHMSCCCLVRLADALWREGFELVIVIYSVSVALTLQSSVLCVCLAC